ncbi:hypothetical protein ADUPG1_002007, partial [Aduncisulcus paluster]
MFSKSHPDDGSKVDKEEEKKPVNDLSKLELEIGRTFSIDLNQVSGSGKTHTFVKAHKKVYKEHETRVGMIALSTNTRLSDVGNKIMIYLKEAMFFYSSAFSTEEECIKRVLDKTKKKWQELKNTLKHAVFDTIEKDLHDDPSYYVCQAFQSPVDLDS